MYDDNIYSGGVGKKKKKTDDNDSDSKKHSGPRTGSYNSIKLEYRKGDSTKRAEISKFENDGVVKERANFDTNRSGSVDKSVNRGPWDIVEYSPDALPKNTTVPYEDKHHIEQMKTMFGLDGSKVLNMKGGKSKKSKKSKCVSCKKSKMDCCCGSKKKSSKKKSKCSSCKKSKMDCCCNKKKSSKKKSKKGGSCCGKP